MQYRNICAILMYAILLSHSSVAERFQYMSTEHPVIDYYNPKFLSYFNVTSQRYGRNDPFYYVGMHYESLATFGNNLTFHFYFYEWLTNQYKRGFVEMHIRGCDLIHKNEFFGPAMRQGKFKKPCPYEPGVYNLYNMTVPVKAIPPHFPFTKGRIYINVTATDTNECVGAVHIDMEIKQFNTNRIIRQRKSDKQSLTPRMSKFC